MLRKLNTYSSMAELLSGLVDVRSFRVNLVVLAAHRSFPVFPGERIFSDTAGMVEKCQPEQHRKREH